MPVDEGRLLTFLDGRRQAATPLVGAVYDGLADRVRRGEFALEETEGGAR